MYIGIGGLILLIILLIILLKSHRAARLRPKQQDARTAGAAIRRGRCRRLRLSVRLRPLDIASPGGRAGEPASLHGIRPSKRCRCGRPTGLRGEGFRYRRQGGALRSNRDFRPAARPPGAAAFALRREAHHRTSARQCARPRFHSRGTQTQPLSDGDSALI